MRLRRLAVPLLLTVILFPVLTGAEEPQNPTVKLDERGGYLTDGDGMSVYIYLRDGFEDSNCYDRCAENWPPLTVDGRLVAGSGVSSGLLDTIRREDGTTQVTYNGWPLYYHARDAEPGATIGHRLGDIFYLIAPSGLRIDAEPTAQAASATDTAQEEQQVADAELDPIMSAGQAVYQANCSMCHGDDGKGAIGPGLDGTSGLERATYVIGTILNGRSDHGMPAWKDQLADDEIAAVATYIRNAWSNDFGPITEEEVAAER